ncbi:MAG: septum formation protein Maf [Candidatus Heimdallarchaeota archaeon]|nr:MAG: septum formation protein Maf [Candidatus Heimdallarchaeota archaeon]
MSSFPQIILASQSAARAKLLTQLQLPFISIPSEIDEKDPNIRVFSEPPKFIQHISQKKVETVAFNHQLEKKKCIIIGCDTIVLTQSDVVLGKPKDENEARKMLQTLSGRIHKVLTGCTIILYPHKTIYQTVISTSVTFRVLAEDELNYYLEKGEWQNRAGGYAIQGLGALLIKEVKGDYYNVVGLPLSWIWETLWNHYNKSLLGKPNIK